MPITRPLRSSIGPPLLPGLAAASDCTSVTPPLVRSPLTMPRDTLFCSVPSAEPITITSWPGLERLRRAHRQDTAATTTACATFSTAMSNAGRARVHARVHARPIHPPQRHVAVVLHDVHVGDQRVVLHEERAAASRSWFRPARSPASHAIDHVFERPAPAPAIGWRGGDGGAAASGSAAGGRSRLGGLQSCRGVPRALLGDSSRRAGAARRAATGSLGSDGCGMCRRRLGHGRRARDRTSSTPRRRRAARSPMNVGHARWPGSLAVVVDDAYRRLRADRRRSGTSPPMRGTRRPHDSGIGGQVQSGPGQAWVIIVISAVTQPHIRNFSIIAHIDHGKSTLADRFLEVTGALQAREMSAQVLDSMDLERERGITIKAHPVRLNYTASDGQTYILNLIDTPGHVDFSYEVTRSLAACEGALLLVDASQGVEAQTLANAYLAVENNLEIIPVINKIDLPSAQPEEARRQLEEIIGLDGDTRDSRQRARKAAASRRSSKPSSRACRRRKAIPTAPLKALIFDSWYDAYRGVVIVVRVLEGTIRNGMKVTLMNTRAGPRGRVARRVHAEGGAGRAARAGRSRLHRVRHQGRGRRADRRHRHRNRPPDAGAVPRLQGAEADGVRRACIRSKAISTRSCASRSRSCGSTTRRSSSSRKRRWRSASASAAASSACCTWRSCRSVSSASSTWTSSPRRRACCTA